MDDALIKQGDGWRGWAALLLLPALLFVALLPRGYMPDVQALRQGALALTICRVAEAREADIGQGDDRQYLPACPFGLLPVLSVPVDLSAMPLPWRWAVAGAGMVVSSVWQAAARVTGLGARGPPGA